MTLLKMQNMKTMMMMKSTMINLFSIFYPLVMLIFTLIGFVSGWILHKEFGYGKSTDQCTQECCNRSIKKR